MLLTAMKSRVGSSDRKCKSMRCGHVFSLKSCETWIDLSVIKLPILPFCNSLSNKVVAKEEAVKKKQKNIATSGKIKISAPQTKCSALKFPIWITVLEGDWTNLLSVTFEAGQTYFFAASTTLGGQHPRGELGCGALVDNTHAKKKKRRVRCGEKCCSLLLF